MVDFDYDKLWKQCQDLIPANHPGAIPAYIGRILEYKVYIVDGDLIKIHCNMDFVEGSNFRAADYVPGNQIWLDNNIDIHDWAFLLFHESVELLHMKTGIPYNQAHDIANEFERKVREEVHSHLVF